MNPGGTCRSNILSDPDAKRRCCLRLIGKEGLRAARRRPILLPGAGKVAMGRALRDDIDVARDSPDAPPLEDQLASIMDAVEAEPVPDNLRKLAAELETALESRRKPKRSN